MNVLVLGGGGREHAIAWKVTQSPLVEEVYCAPGNPGTAQCAVNVDLDLGDFDRIANFASESRIDVVIVGPEDPLAAGLADSLRSAGISCLGPVSAAARIESSKSWAKHLMAEAGVPTAGFEVAATADEAIRILERCSFPVVVKADGLAQGKGVTVAGSFDEAKQAVRSLMVDRVFGPAGDRVVVEDFLVGQEVSAFAVTDGEWLKMLPFARDFKRVFDADEGLNTGSMGCYSPVAIVDADLALQIERDVMLPILDTLARKSLHYVGFLYAGLMITDDGPQVIEFNCRLGDPEAQVVLPLLDGDLAQLALLAANGRLHEAEAGVKGGAACGIVAASGGYPGKYVTGHGIEGLARAEETALVFHAGTAVEDGLLSTAGGRVLAVVGQGDTLPDARLQAYAAMSEIGFEGIHYRSDIGATDPERILA